MAFSSARACALAILVSGLEATAQRISVSDFAGRGSGAVRNQLIARLCTKVECVPATKVTVGGRFDPKKAQKEGLEAFVTGTVTKRGKQAVIELVLLTQKGAQKTKRVLPLDRSGLLSEQSVAAVAGLFKTPPADPRPSARAPVPTPEPSRPSAPALVSTAPAPSVEREPPAEPVAEPPPSPTQRPEPQVRQVVTQPSSSATSQVSSPAAKPVFLSVELGSDVLNRQLRYFNVAQASADIAPLRGYDLDAFALPTLKVEFYPLALVRTDKVAGLGIEGAFGFNPLLRSHTASGSEMYATTAVLGQAALRWKLVVSDSYPLSVTPFVGFRVQSFTVEAQSVGTPKLIPNFNYVSLRAGLALDVPVVPDLLFIVARVSGLPVFSSGEILSSAYFKSGSTLGVEVSGGLRVKLARVLDLLATFEMSQYQLSFRPNDGDPYVAQNDGSPVYAVDRYLGGNFTVRLAL